MITGISSTNLIRNYAVSSKVSHNVENNNVSVPFSGTNLLEAYLQNQANINVPTVNQTQSAENINYKNDLRKLFTTNSAKILAIIPRSFTAQDTNGNEYIDQNEKPGTFLGAISRLDEVKAQ
jgi:hypothetical protein